MSKVMVNAKGEFVKLTSENKEFKRHKIDIVRDKNTQTPMIQIYDDKGNPKNTIPASGITCRKMAYEAVMNIGQCIVNMLRDNYFSNSDDVYLSPSWLLFMTYKWLTINKLHDKGYHVPNTELIAINATVMAEGLCIGYYPENYMWVSHELSHALRHEMLEDESRGSDMYETIISDELIMRYVGINKDDANVFRAALLMLCWS